MRNEQSTTEQSTTNQQPINTQSAKQSNQLGKAK
jgi:hypothetical protein